MKNGTRLLLLVLLCVGLLLAVSAQEFNRPAPVPTKAYVVAGARHGASFFPRANYAAVKPKTPGVMDFGHYHANDEINAFLAQWAKDYPQLVDLYSVGKSFEGRDIMQITVTNKATGKDTDKPAKSRRPSPPCGSPGMS